MTSKTIRNIKVVGVDNVKKDCAGKRYEFILKIFWSDDTEALVYRPHSMFFDLQGILAEMFKNEKIPTVPVIRFNWNIFSKSNNDKGCKSLEDFCKKIISLPRHISEASIVLHFFESWGTDVRTNRKSTLFEPNIGREKIISHKDRRAEETSTISTDKDDQYNVITNYVASSQGEITLIASQVVTVIEKNEKGWWFIADATGRQGWAPATYLESVSSHDDISDDGGYRWRSVRDTNGKGDIYTSVLASKAMNLDELSYGVGEEIEVLDKSNYGWWRVRLGAQVGITPATNLQKHDDTCIYESADELDRKISISSKSGLYAVVRKAPPRRESVQSTKSLSPKRTKSLSSNGESFKKHVPPSKFIYSTTSFSGGNFVLEEETRNDLSVPEVPIRRSSADEVTVDPQSVYINVERSTDQNLTSENRSKSHGDITENVNNIYFDLVEEGRPRKISFLGDEDVYIVLQDFYSQGKEEINFMAGSSVTLMSANGEWLFVMFENDSCKQGWIPANYLQKKSNEQSVTMQPIPKPRPRPKPRPLDSLPNVKQEATGIRKTENVTVPSVSVSDVGITPLSSQLLAQIQALRTYDEDLYEEPGRMLKSGYDVYAWYYGNISRASSESLLSTHGRQREFLVRESQRAPGSYAISVKYCYRIRHFPITRTETNELIIGTLHFTELPDIIIYYQSNALFISENGEPISLGNELPKERIPPS